MFVLFMYTVTNFISENFSDIFMENWVKRIQDIETIDSYGDFSYEYCSHK